MHRPLLGVAALGLAVAAPALAQPDLSVTLASPTLVTGTAGSSHTVWFALRNDGNAAVTSARARIRVPAGARLDPLPNAPGVTITHTAAAITVDVSAPLPAGGVYTAPVAVRITNEGVNGTMTAEVVAQSPADLDSTPGDGMGDDYAAVQVVGTPIPALPAGYQVQAVAFGRFGTPYAAVYQRGVYRYTGGAWQPINAGLTNLNVWDVDAVPAAGTDALVAATIGGGLYRFDPATETWSARPSGLVNARGVVAFDGNTLFATGDLATGQGAVYRSTDDGRTWTALGIVGEGSMEPWTIAPGGVHPVSGAPVLYVGTRRGLFKSTDGGWTFAATGFTGNRADAFDVVAVGQTVIVGTRDGFHRSTDGGATFGPLLKSTPAGARARNVYDLEYQPPQGALPGRLYVSHWGRPGVVVSTDLGQTFADVPLGTAPADYVERIAFGPSGQVFLAMEQGGLHVTVPSEPTPIVSPESPVFFGVELLGATAQGARQVRVQLYAERPVRLDLYDALGRHVRTLVDGRLAAGTHTFALGLDAAAAGVYLLRATDGAEVHTRTVLLAR